QLPICAIPAQQLLELCDVFLEEIVEENFFLPIHRPLVGHNISIFTANRAEWFETEKRKDGSERFTLFLLKVLKLHRLDLVAREEFEQTLELLRVKSSIHISKTTSFGRRRAGDTYFLFSHGIEKIQRLATSKSLHVPVSKGAVDRISQEGQQFNFRIVLPNPFRCGLVINVARRAITGDGGWSKRWIMFV